MNRKNHNIPIGRVMVDRKTGQNVGPIAPIDREDYPYQEVGWSETLWRYLDFFKFEDMLKTSTLYFARPDSFSDSFEGKLSRGNKERSSKSETALRQCYEMADNTIDVDLSQIVFILCWHRNTKESMKMWRAYTKGSESVVVTSSGRALNCFIKGIFKHSVVKYQCLDCPRTGFDNYSLFFYKPKEYSFEREYRILKIPTNNEVFSEDCEEDKFRKVPIRLNKVIHRVITHPSASDSFKKIVEELMKKHLPALRREDSFFSSR